MTVSRNDKAVTLYRCTRRAPAACVASVSVLFRSKIRGARVKDPAKNGASKRGGHFLRGQKTRGSRSSVFLCSETVWKRLLRRLEYPPKTALSEKCRELKTNPTQTKYGVCTHHNNMKFLQNCHQSLRNRIKVYIAVLHCMIVKRI